MECWGLWGILLGADPGEGKKKLWDGEKLDSVFDIEMEESMDIVVGNVFNGMKGCGERGLGPET